MNHDSELWQEFNQNGSPKVGVGHPKSEFDDYAKICGSAHVWIWRIDQNEKIEVLLQKRAATKLVKPNYWDISAAGHINLGEDAPTAAHREASEEIGLDINVEKLHFAWGERHRSPRYIELLSIFFYRLDTDVDFNLADGEVAELKWIGLDELDKWISDENADEKINLTKGSVYYRQLLENLENLAFPKSI